MAKGVKKKSNVVKSRENVPKKATPKKTTVKKKPKVTKKKVTKKPASRKAVNTTLKKSNETLLIENFVSLQKVMTNLSIKFSELSQNISKMLFVFEEAAKNLAQSEKVMDEHFGEKVNSLLEQNKNITKNLGLMDERIKRQGMVKSPSSTFTSMTNKSNNNLVDKQMSQRPSSKLPEIKPNINNNFSQKTNEGTPKIKAPENLPQI